MCRSSKPRILYIDDDFDSCELVILMLRMADDSYDVTAFTDPEEAIAFMENQPVVLFVFDYALPEMTGIELCRRIRHADTQTPIHFLFRLWRAGERPPSSASGECDRIPD